VLDACGGAAVVEGLGEGTRQPDALVELAV
jgi:hypothetical protein